MNVKSISKLARVVLASTVGSLLWAGCAEPRVAVHDPAVIAYAPVDLTKRRPDTNPELRSGMWQRNAEKPTPSVVLAPSITNPDGIPGSEDPAYLLGYSSEVINSVPPGAEESIIIEAAGAEPVAPRRTWRERWFHRKPVQTPPPSVEPQEEREIIIEREKETKSEIYRPSSTEVNQDEGGQLLKTLFVKK